MHNSFFIMSRRYDPRHVFNHRRTSVQQKGQSNQVKLIDEAPPRVDDQILDKAYRLCKAYKKIPEPVLADLEVDGELVLGFDQYFAEGSRFYSVIPTPIFNGLIEGQTIQLGYGVSNATIIPLFQWMVNVKTIAILNELFIYREGSNAVTIYFGFLDENDELIGTEDRTSAGSSVSSPLKIIPSSSSYLQSRGVNYNNAKKVRIYRFSTDYAYVTINFFRIILQ